MPSASSNSRFHAGVQGASAQPVFELLFRILSSIPWHRTRTNLWGIMTSKLLRSKETTNMARKNISARSTAADRGKVSSQPRLHQRAPEIQAYGTVSHMLPLDLEEPVRLEMTEQLNLLLADTSTLRDLYKKCHWQVAGPT